MISVIDIESVIYDILNVPSLKGLISGDVYTSGDRPTNSGKEDVEINTIALTQEPYPQEGVSNINIYVPDIVVNLDGEQQQKADKTRLKLILEKVKSLLSNTKAKHVMIQIESENIIQDKDIQQHFVNLRITYFYYEKEI
jgi:hypothetical protein